MRKAAAKKIQALEDRIDALRNKQDEIRSKEREHEKAEEERKWKRDNASCIKFCKGLLGKVFTFGDFKSVIRHQVDKDNGVVIRETKTQYICKNDIRYRKPKEEVDGCSVKQVGADRWDMSATLRIKED